jgi:tagatose 1,6-diphosphate aldolase
MQGLLNPDDPLAVTKKELKSVKMSLIKGLASSKSPSRASGILVDPDYSFERAFLNACDLHPSVGLLMGLEVEGHGDEDEFAPITRIFGGLSVDQGVQRIKMRGASAVKMLVYYNPNGPTRRKQESIVKASGRACKKHDIPLLVEPVSHSLVHGPYKTRNQKEFAEIKPEIVVETARELTKPEYGVDILKAEFPLDMSYAEALGQDPVDVCRELDQVSLIPWIILSAGVDFEEFKDTLQQAIENGASGFLCGRALWKEALQAQDMDAWILNTGTHRLNNLVDIVEMKAKPWYKKYVDSIEEIRVERGE